MHSIQNLKQSVIKKKLIKIQRKHKVCMFQIDNKMHECIILVKKWKFTITFHYQYLFFINFHFIDLTLNKSSMQFFFKALIKSFFDKKLVTFKKKQKNVTVNFNQNVIAWSSRTLSGDICWTYTIIQSIFECHISKTNQQPMNKTHCIHALHPPPKYFLWYCITIIHK